MKSWQLSIVGCVVLLLAVSTAAAHHSFAVYDFSTRIEFVGTVETLSFRNPHIAMTLKVTRENGETEIVNFIEGAPANMLARRGLVPDMIAPGTKVTAVGSPLIEDPGKLFLQRIVLEDGRSFDATGSR